MTRSPSFTVRIYALPAPERFALARRGAIKVWTAATERRLREALSQATSDLDRPQGLAEVSIRLDAEGRVLDVRLDKSCGSAALDGIWTEAVRRITPLPPPPSALVNIQILIQLEFAVLSHSAA